jgi:hypothetical protein
MFRYGILFNSYKLTVGTAHDHRPFKQISVEAENGTGL